MYIDDSDKTSKLVLNTHEDIDEKSLSIGNSQVNSKLA